MAKPISFNMWITAPDNQPTPGDANLGTMWKHRRGRLTRESVEKRAQTEYGCAPGVGYAAWDAYRAATDEIIAPQTEQPRLPGV